MKNKKACFWLIAALFAVSCASIGTPSGGPRDEDPPRFMDANPGQGALNFSGSRATLVFNELVNVKDAFNKVVVSPPSATTPRVSSQGRRINIEFRDTLLPNTTYTVDFGDAIEDNNEGNKLENFIYTFSTGDTLDSLMVSGMVLAAEDLEPAQGIYVGLHSNLNDSAFKKTRFDRIAKTDAKGRFVIGGLAPGEYRIFALEDKDGDLAWSSPEETLAFYDFTIVPTTEMTTAIDSIFNLKTGEVDSVVRRERVRYLPNNILLRSYNTGYKQQYITKYERVDSTRLNFIFNANADSVPEFEIIESEGTAVPLASKGILEKSITNDTITFWLTDREIIATDTLRIAAHYFRADSVYMPLPYSDTLRLVTQRPKAVKEKPAKRKKNEEEISEPEIPMIQLKVANSRVEVNTPLIVESPVPLERLDTAAIRLEVKVDSLWVDVGRIENGPPLTVRPDSLNPRRLVVDYPWQFEGNYKLTVDSLAGRSVYGLDTESLMSEFKIRPETEYGKIIVSLNGLPTGSPSFVDLLDGSGKAIATATVDETMKVEFPFLQAGKYHLRVVMDANGNGKFDPGNYDLGIQPDVSYYYPETIELKQNWDQQLDWSIFSTSVDLMKPAALRKGK